MSGTGGVFMGLWGGGVVCLLGCVMIMDNEYMTEMTLWDHWLRYGSFGFLCGDIIIPLGNNSK